MSSHRTTWIARGSSTGTARRSLPVPERSLIEAIAAELGEQASAGTAAGTEGLLLGIGDDAAVVGCAGVCVTSVDAMVEGTHFRLGEGFSEPAEVGHRALAGALSDLAAMGARPGQAYFVLGLPHGFSEQRALELMRAAGALASDTGTVIAGGDVVAAPILIVSVTAVGWAARTRPSCSPVREPGPGTSWASPAASAPPPPRWPRWRDGLRARRRAPPPWRAPPLPAPGWPRAAALAALGAHAMIDLSDGLAADAAQLASRSGVQLELRLRDLPLAEGVAEVAGALGVEPWRLAAGGGEDYELCFCAAPEDRGRLEQALRQDGLAGVSWIGTVREGPAGVVLLDADGRPVQLEGYEHRWWRASAAAPTRCRRGSPGRRSSSGPRIETSTGSGVWPVPVGTSWTRASSSEDTPQPKPTLHMAIAAGPTKPPANSSTAAHTASPTPSPSWCE